MVLDMVNTFLVLFGVGLVTCYQPVVSTPIQRSGLFEEWNYGGRKLAALESKEGLVAAARESPRDAAGTQIGGSSRRWCRYLCCSPLP
jgi:hypothetical protein